MPNQPILTGMPARFKRGPNPARGLRRAVPGIMFLSGGQSDVLATQHLNAMNQLSQTPWPLTFSFGRALQGAPRKTWLGRVENVAAAQQAPLHRAKCNSLARFGKYSREMQ